MSNIRVKDLATTATSPAADDVAIIDGATGTRKIAAGPLGGNFDENIVVEFGGNKTTYASNFLRSENGSYYIDAYNVGGDIVFRTSVASALDTQSMVIDGATGKIGIGGSPTYELDVTAANARIAATSTSGCVNHLQSDNTGAYVGPLSNHNLYFKTNNITRATIDTGGNLILQKGGGAYLQLKDASAVRGSINVGTSDGLTFTTGASFSTAMQIDSAGNVAIGHGAFGAKLDIATATDTAGIFIRDNSDSSITHQIYNSSGNGNLAIYADGQVAKVNINSAGNSYFNGGNVGVGGTPDVKFHINEAAGLAKMRLQGGAAGADTFDIMQGVTGVTNGGLSIYDVNETATRLVIDSSGRVSIGNDNAGIAYSEADDLVVGNNAVTAAGMTVTTTGGGTGSLFFSDGSSGADTYRGQIRYLHSANQMMFAVDANEAFRIGAGGDIVMASGNGIDFSSGGASSVLDDYERGSATPTDASGAGLTLAGVGMNYVKIGSQVTAWVRLTYPTTSNANNSAIGGFPFAFGANDIDRVGGSLSFTTLNAALTVLPDNSTSLVRFRKLDGGTYTNAELSGKQVWFSVTYDVS